jgi:hypothetical protein
VPTPEDLAQRQLDTFNTHDLEGFLPVFADDVEIRSLTSGEVVLRGMGAFRERYESYFASNPAAHAELAGRLVLGRFVIDHERIALDAGPPTSEALAVYEVEGDRIARMWFIESDET